MSRQHSGMLPDSNFGQQVIQLVLRTSDLEGRDMSTDEKELVLTYLTRYQLTLEQLRVISWPALIGIVDLVPEISGISVHKLKAYREPANNWDRFWWWMIDTPMDWRFEVIVHGRPIWRYRIVDTWEEAQKIAREAQEKFRPF